MVLKTTSDYVEQVCSEFPEVPPQDIKRILNYGFKSILLYTQYGGDIVIRKKGLWFYCGRMMKDTIKYLKYYLLKMSIKLRILYRVQKIKWDGYYYFARSKRQYDEYLALIKGGGRPKKTFIFKNVFCYKIFDECNILNRDAVAIFRLKQPIEHGFTIFFWKLKTQDAELVLERDPLKLTDILLENYDYKFIKKQKKYGKH